MEMNVDKGPRLAVTSVSQRKQDLFDKVLECLEEILIALNVTFFSLRTIKVKAKKVCYWMVSAHTPPTNSQWVVICFCTKVAKLLKNLKVLFSKIILSNDKK